MSERERDLARGRRKDQGRRGEEAMKTIGRHAATAGLKPRGPAYGIDKGQAPQFKGQSKVEDGQNINIPRDAQGYSITIQDAAPNLTSRGEGNYVAPFRQGVGPDAFLKGRGGYADVNNESTADEGESSRTEPDEEDELD